MDILDTVSPEQDKIIPKRRVKREPWVTNGLLKSSNTVDTYYSMSLKKPKDHPHVIKYKQYRNLYNRIKRDLKSKYYFELLNEYKHNIRKTWSIMKKVIGKENDKTSITSKFNMEGKEISDPKEIANGFCEYFTNIGKNLAARIKTPDTDHSYFLKKVQSETQRSLLFSPTVIQEINSCITLMKSKRSTGHDGMSSWLLKKFSHELSEPLCTLINKSLSS